MKIKVTKHHIENGTRKDSHHCMIADAIHSADPTAKYVLVDLQSIRWSNLETGQRYTALTPAIAQSKLIAFDTGKKVEPFMFTVHPITFRKVGWKANHPRSTLKKNRSRRKTGKGRVVKQREFGVRMFVEK